MDAVDAARIGFAAAVVVVGASLAVAALARAPRRTLAGIAVALGLGAVAAWVGVALDPGVDAVIPAAGITLAFGALYAWGIIRARNGP